MTNHRAVIQQTAPARRARDESGDSRARHDSASRLRRTLFVLVPVAAAIAACHTPPDEKPATVQQAATAPGLGTTKSFALLAGSAVTNTGPTLVTGNLGVSPGMAVSGFPPGLVAGGTIETGNAVALQAQNDATTAYNELAGEVCNVDLSNQDLGGLTLTPGTYCFSSSAQLTGVLTLNALGDPAAVFVFQMGSTLTTASGASVDVINGGQPCNVFWQIGSSATLGTNTSFAGSIIALTSITLTTDVVVRGRVLARNGAVTMDTNTVSAASCAGGGGAGGAGAGGAGTGGAGTGGAGTGGAGAGGAGAGGAGTGGTGTGGCVGTAGQGGAVDHAGGAGGCGPCN